MSERGNLEPPRFDINAAVVFRLGEELITDVVQALVELVKNSYDADATWVKVTIDTQVRNEWGRRYADASGVIRIEDDGDGMDGATITRGWLTIAASQKREAKAAHRVSRLGRTPIGDKGLGRLGVQRLARNVEIVTRPCSEQQTEYYVAFSWTDFREASRLRDVPLVFEPSKVGARRSGTTLILSDLREPEIWQGKRHLEDLQRKLSAMISPFQEARDFVVHLEVDGKRLELTEIAQRVRDTAMLRYKLAFDGETLELSGVARLAYLQPSLKEDQRYLGNLCRSDDGKSLFEFLATQAGKRRPPRFVRSEQAGWFVEFGVERSLADLPGVQRVQGVIANPGPFHGEVDAVSLENPDLTRQAFNRQSDYRQLVRDLAGIRVYRDGFGIRVGEDWLGLGKQWTRGTSYYGLRPGNVLGFVAISARDNPALQETTSREGFQATPHYENFLELLAQFVRFAGDVQEFLRRGALKYLNAHRDRLARVEPSDPHSTITQRIEGVAGILSAEKSKIREHAGTMRSTAAEATQTLVQVREDLTPALLKDQTVVDALGRIEAVLDEVLAAAARSEEMLEEVSVALDGASELQSLREVLDRRWTALQEEVAALYESISLGLTAEALSHEIHNIADGLARRSSALLRDFRSKEVKRASVVAFIEHVRSSVAALRKQLAHLTPSLRFLRERRERIDIVAFLGELAMYYNDRFSARNIRVKVDAKVGRHLAVSMSKGKLTQVLDNLILNAEYWLNEAIRGDSIKKGEISVVVDAPVLRIMDNGRGVEESVEESLFEPFVTTKRSGEGRGLGLFVVRQLLDSEGCAIILLPERNTSGRRYAFEVDLSGAVCE